MQMEKHWLDGPFHFLGVVIRLIVNVKPADKGGAIVVWRKDLYLAEAERQLSDESTYRRLDHDITDEHQDLISSTIDELVDRQEAIKNYLK